MGVVYRAQDPKIGRTLAIKSIRLNELTDPEERGRMRERLFREAQSAGILSHPNIVTIYDVSEEEGLAYIFMEFVNGMALDDLLRAMPPPTGELVMELLSQTAAALDYAHKNGIIHRDIKPANIMVHEGRSAKVCDFGVAKIVSQQMTQAGMLMGTPSYMSPEQIEGRPMDGRSDQFALAVMVFDILTKEKPFAGDTLPILLYKICRADPPSASELNTTLGIWVDPVLRKALAKNPDDRYQSCSAFIAELRRALDERPGWMLPGKGFPGEDNTTGAGHHGTTTAGPGFGQTKGSSGGILSRPVPPLPGAPTSAGFTRSTANPSIAVPVPAPPSHFQSQASLAQPMGPVDAIPLPRSRAEPKKSSPLMFALPVLLLAGGGIGYFAYQKFSEPKPAVTDNPPSKAVEKKPDGFKPEAAKKDPPKVENPKPPIQAKTDPPPPHETVPEVATPTTPKDSKPNASGQFAVRFEGIPVGATITVDGDASTACKSPCSIPLSKGRHTITGVLEGFTSLSRAIEVAGATLVPVDLREAVGMLIVISTPPGLTVLLNGQERPEKTPAKIRLKPGSYQVAVVGSDGQKSTDTTTIKDGVTSTVTIGFQ